MVGMINTGMYVTTPDGEVGRVLAMSSDTHAIVRFPTKEFGERIAISLLTPVPQAMVDWVTRQYFLMGNVEYSIKD